MIYTKENLAQLAEEHAAVREKRNRIMASYVQADFRNDRACEFATHGFPRRIRLLAHCIESIFEDLPPDTIQPPSNDVILDVTVYLQAFVFNVFGCIDNLALIWVREKGLTKENRAPFRNLEIGFFGAKYKPVLDSLSDEFSAYLKGLEPWFENLRNFRHALAHRIPPYIPPYYVPDDKLQEYEEIENRINEAVRQGEYDEADRLGDEQTILILFRPLATHSFSENANKMLFHPQMIYDFNTVEEIARKLLQELEEPNDT